MFSILPCFLFIIIVASCNSKNENAESHTGGDELSVNLEKGNTSYSIDENSVNTNENKTFATFHYENNILFSRDDFESNVFIHDGALVLQLLKDQEEILVSFGGSKLYNKKPFKGNFTLSPQENENTVLVSIHINEKENADAKKMKAPMFFGGTATITRFTSEEISVDIDAKGGFYSDLNTPEEWKPITAKIRMQNPQFSERNATTQKLFY